MQSGDLIATKYRAGRGEREKEKTENSVFSGLPMIKIKSAAQF